MAFEAAGQGVALHVALPTNSSSVLQPVGLVMQGMLTHFSRVSPRRAAIDLASRFEVS